MFNHQPAALLDTNHHFEFIKSLFLIANTTKSSGHELWAKAAAKNLQHSWDLKRTIKRWRSISSLKLHGSPWVPNVPKSGHPPLGPRLFQKWSQYIPVIEKNEAATHIFSHEIRQLLGTNSGKDSLGDRWRPGPGGCQLVSWFYSSGDFSGIFSGIFLGFFWDFFWDFSGIFLGFFWDFFWNFFWDFSGIFLGFFWDFSGIVLGFFWDFSGIVLGLFWDFSGISDMKSIRSCFLVREPGRSQRLLGLFHVVPLTSCIRWGGSVMIKGVNLGDVTNLLPGVACVLCCPCTSFVFFVSINDMNIFQKLANLTWKKTTFFHCSTQYSMWCSCWMFANYEAFLSYRDISRPQLGWNMIRMGRQFMLRFHIPKKEYCTVYIYI